MKRIHRDVEFAVNDCSGKQRLFKTPGEASAFAISIALSNGCSVYLDVLVHSRAGARAYQGDDGAEEYDEDPEASVFERIEIKVNSMGRVA